MERDPVCGMKVDPERVAGVYEHGGHTYFFCSSHCLEKFRSQPEAYLHRPVPLAMPVATAQITRNKPAAAPPLRVSEPAALQVESQVEYTCPMHPEVRETVRQPKQAPGSCPECGMALEPREIAALAAKTEFVCPMHPEIVRDKPGACPICGMALEPRTVTVEKETNPELIAMTRRLRWSPILTAPILLLERVGMLPGQPVQKLLSPRVQVWVELLLATPVVLWGGWPFLDRKSTRLNSSHGYISYAVFCLKKKKEPIQFYGAHHSSKADFDHADTVTVQTVRY